MDFPFVYRNSGCVPANEALISLHSVELTYGFGVYETLRVNNSNPRFADEHIARLMCSAELIGLEHTFSAPYIQNAVAQLVAATPPGTYNLKILLIGATTPDKCELIIMPTAPFFVDKKLYSEGAVATTVVYERFLPLAKTLNMLPSYLHYRAAKKQGAYDVLFVDQAGCIREGSRTNFFTIKNKTIFSPPPDQILAGVMRAHVLAVASSNGFDIVKKPIARDSLSEFDGAFLTSTSTKILPLRSVGDHTFGQPSPALLELMATFNASLER